MKNNKDFSGKNNPNFKTGFCIKGQKPSFYISLQNMKQRCLNNKNHKFKNYGGRGITICEEWLDKQNGVKNFYNWSIANGYKEGLSIDRIDNNGNYEPSNCRWISMSENSRKKSTTKLSFEDAKKIRNRFDEDWHEIAKEYNVRHGTIWFIMNNFTHVEDGECMKKLKERNDKKNK